MSSTAEQVLRRAPTEPLPVLVLTGFLGAGKTTLLNYLLSGLSGSRVAALVNDFGAVEVDALNIASRVDSTISLSGGCMCCQIDVSEVDDTLADLAAPERELDLVVIEASGLAEPDVLAGMVRRQSRTAISYAGLINVVDALHFADALARHPQLAQHLAISDLLVVTKADLLSNQAQSEFLDFVRDRAPRVPTTIANYGRVNLRLLFDSGEYARTRAANSSHPKGETEASPHAHEHSHAHLHDDYESCVARPARPLHPRRFLSACGAMPAGVFRAKGLVVLGDVDGAWRYRLNTVGEMLDLIAEGPAAATDRTEVVMIGTALAPDADNFLHAAQLQPEEPLREADRYCLEPYLVAPPEASDVAGWLYEEPRYTPLTSAATMLSDPDDPDSADPTQTP